MAEEYKTIVKPSQSVFKDKGSRFIGFLYHIENELDVKNIIADIKKQYYDATHHCYAYIIGHYGTSATRVNDDGEPSGTAGKPIYGQLLSNDLKDVLLVVIRYFGGTKLGVSGLINAYKTCAATTIENAEIITLKIKNMLQVEFAYQQMNQVMTILKKIGAEIKNTSYKESSVLIDFTVLIGDVNQIQQLFSKVDNVELRNIKVM